MKQNTPPVNFRDLEEAIMLVDEMLINTEAWVARDTGIVHIRSDEYMEDETPLPADIDDRERYVPVPGSRSLDLGRDLVFRFAEEYLAGDQETVRGFFRKKGAYARFSHLLETRGTTQEWYRFREEATKAALRL